MESAEQPIVHLPTRDANFRQSMVQSVQKIVPSHALEHATPPAAQPIPISKAFKEVGAERPDEEHFPSVSDLGRHIRDINKEGLAAGEGVKSNGNLAQRVIKRAERMIRLKAA